MLPYMLRLEEGHTNKQTNIAFYIDDRLKKIVIFFIFSLLFLNIFFQFFFQLTPHLTPLTPHDPHLFSNGGSEFFFMGGQEVEMGGQNFF